MKDRASRSRSSVRAQGGASLPAQNLETKGTPAMMNSFFRKDDGQDMVEYALLASFISIVAIVALRAIGPLVRTIYTNIQAALT
jgi:Flp pilus assembly pilin Flp